MVLNDPDSKNKVWVSAHRGNSRYCPDNTMSSFISALQYPVDQLELDLHMSRDKEIVLAHNHSVDKTSDGTGRVCDLTLKELKKLDVGSWKDEKFKGERVPTFEEFLDYMSQYKKLTFNIEFKDFPHMTSTEWAREAVDKAIALVEKKGMAERCWFNCMSVDILEYIDEKYNHSYKLHCLYPTSMMFSTPTRDPYDYVHCVCLFGTQEQPVVDISEFDRARSRNVQPWVHYPSDDIALYEQAVKNGCRLITANDPKKAIDYLHSLGLHEA